MYASDVRDVNVCVSVDNLKNIKRIDTKICGLKIKYLS